MAKLVVFTVALTASAAEGFAEPADRPAPTEGRRRALGRRAREIVDEIVEKRGLKKE